MKKGALLLTLGALVACSTKKDYAPYAGGDCPAGQTCGGILGPGGGTTTDGGTDALSDAPFEVGEAGVSLTSVVRPLNAFPTDPTTATGFSPGVTVQALGIAGGNVQAVTAGDGTFTLDGIAPSVGAPTWVSIVRAGIVRQIVGFHATSATMTLPTLPYFDESLPATTASSTGVVLPAECTSTGCATVVVRVVGSAGTPLSGVSAAPIGTSSVLYDSGANSVESGKATGTFGTIVFLGLTTSPAPVTLTAGGTTYATVQVATANTAVSYLAVQLPL